MIDAVPPEVTEEIAIEPAGLSQPPAAGMNIGLLPASHAPQRVKKSNDAPDSARFPDSRITAARWSSRLLRLLYSAQLRLRRASDIC
jgi:hypothetical protein